MKAPPIGVHNTLSVVEHQLQTSDHRTGYQYLARTVMYAMYVNEIVLNQIYIP